MQHLNKKLMMVATLAGLALGVAGAKHMAHATTQNPSEQASYVRVCRDARGVLDRRACHANDPKRTQLALNLAE